MTQDNAPELFFPYGKCQCGCGEDAPIADKGTDENTVGEPKVTVFGHHTRYYHMVHWRDRFWDQVEFTDECWLWRGAMASNGYGQFGVRGTQRYAHRVAWEFFNRERVGGAVVCHHCDVRECVNPDHLYRGTHEDNMRDMVERGRSAKGERHSQATLSRRQVLQIRHAAREGIANRQLGRVYGVNPTTIDKIVNRERWKHI